MQKANRTDVAPFGASNWKIGIVVAQFNAHITEQLLASALRRAGDYQISPKQITVIKVAGAVEIPVALQALADTEEYTALLAVGCVINGATPHFEYVCKYVSEGILRVSLDAGLPIGFGVLTCQSEEQAQERAHLGGEHLDAALQLAKAIEKVGA
jgi:6,7-dimethyl-8-ribityllumazine synthase